MPLPNEVERRQGALTGWESPLTGTLLPVSGSPSLADLEQGQKLLTSGLLPIGTHYAALPVSGAAAVDCTLRKSAGTLTASIYRTLADHITEKLDGSGTTAAVPFAAFVNGTQQTVSITGLRGERVVLLKLVVTVATQLDQAFYSAR